MGRWREPRPKRQRSSQWRWLWDYTLLKMNALFCLLSPFCWKTNSWVQGAAELDFSVEWRKPKAIHVMHFTDRTAHILSGFKIAHVHSPKGKLNSPFDFFIGFFSHTLVAMCMNCPEHFRLEKLDFLLFFCHTMPHDLQDLSSLTRDWN